MLLTELEIKQALEKARTAFPLLTDWEFNNEENEDYFGFSVWGSFVLDSEDLMSRRFFITLDTYEESWRGHLTTGQPSYLWSSTNEDDAYLLGTESHKSLEEAITALICGHLSDAFLQETNRILGNLDPLPFALTILKRCLNLRRHLQKWD